MRRELTILLSGLGYYRLSAARRKQLGILLGASLAVHVVGLLMFGGWVVMRSRVEEKTVFEIPPPIRTYEPRKLEHEVKVKKQQRSSSRPSMIPRLVSMKASALALPEIKLDPKLIHTSFQPKFKAVSGVGLGVGLGTGYGVGGFGTGVSTFNFFGIRGRGEKIAVLVDVSLSMVEEERGGVDGFRAVKGRVESVINALNEGSLFNVFVFADAASKWQSKMAVANEKHKGAAIAWLRPFNTEGNWGLSGGNIASGSVGLKALGGTTRLDLPLTESFIQGADTILIISDGLPRVRKGHTAEQLAAFRQQQAAHAQVLANWQQQNAGRVQAWQEAVAAAPVVRRKVWVPGRPAQPAIPPRPPAKGPPKEGQPIDSGHPGRPAQPAVPGRWEWVEERQAPRGGGGGGPPQAPPAPQLGDPGFWTLTDFLRHLDILFGTLYEKKGKKKPTIHAIGYQIDKDGSAFLRGLSKAYRGKYRRVARIR